MLIGGWSVDVLCQNLRRREKTLLLVLLTPPSLSVQVQTCNRSLMTLGASNLEPVQTQTAPAAKSSRWRGCTSTSSPGLTNFSIPRECSCHRNVRYRFLLCLRALSMEGLTTPPSSTRAFVSPIVLRISSCSPCKKKRTSGSNMSASSGDPSKFAGSDTSFERYGARSTPEAHLVDSSASEQLPKSRLRNGRFG